MSTDSKQDTTAEATADGSCPIDASMEAVRSELGHMRNDWWWFLLLGILLVVCGTVAISYPPYISVAAVIVLGAALVVGGVPTIIMSFWAGKWSALLLQMLIGILYVMAGMLIMDAPLESTAMLTLFIAAFFIVVGVFRIVASLMIKFPQWGWALLNGVITLLAGIIIYKHFPETALWVIGLLVGLDMLFNGFTWIMLALTIRRIPASEETANVA
jgi:uncharacterized membrane protein HdeD (DUF308 family)